jgi:uncharacterized membrane protein YheB (UPF0754 family)
MNKSLVTNLLATLIVVVGVYSPVHSELILSVGLFALSGAVTNWLAVHMLFEKVPLLYGSGVIPSRFEEFKGGIRQLIMSQFFTQDNIERFIEAEEESAQGVLDLEPILNAVDYDRIFQALIDAIMGSSFGSMLQMVGGVEALEPLREPFEGKMRAVLTEMTESERFNGALHASLNRHKLGADIVGKIETVVDKRLDELTPQLVKEIIQAMIRKHLGWLVVWGGVFGGLIGLLASFI